MVLSRQPDLRLTLAVTVPFKTSMTNSPVACQYSFPSLVTGSLWTNRLTLDNDRRLGQHQGLTQGTSREDSAICTLSQCIFCSFKNVM